MLPMDLNNSCWIFIAWCSQYDSVVFFFILVVISPVAQHFSKTSKNAVLTFFYLSRPLGHVLQVIWIGILHIVLDIYFVNNIKQTILKYIGKFIHHVHLKSQFVHENDFFYTKTTFNVEQKAKLRLKWKKNTTELYWEHYAMNIQQKLLRSISK